MNDSSQRKTGAILSYVSIAINTIIQLLYTPLLIRMLGQSEYGLYSLTVSIIGYLTIMDLGFGNAIIVYTAKYRAQNKAEEEKKLHGMFNIIFKAIGLVALIFGLILFLNVDLIFGGKLSSIELHKMKIMMLILSVNLFITFYFAIYSSIISAYEKFTFQKVIAILQSIMKPLIMIPLLFLGFKSIALCFVVTFANIIVVLSNYLYCNRKLGVNARFVGFDGTLFKTIIGYSIWLFLTAIVDKINWSVDNFVLGAVSGTIAVSIYAIAATINQMFINLSTAISSVLLPKISKLVAKFSKSPDLSRKLSDEWIKVGRLQFIIIFLATSGFFLFGKQFIIWWAGKGFTESYYVALLLILPALFSLIQNLGLSIMQALNKFKFKAISTFVMSVFNIIISIILAKRYGAVGAACGTTISIILCNIIIMNIYYYKVIKLDVLRFWYNILIMFLKYCIPIFLFTIITYKVGVSKLFTFILFVFAYTILYLIVSYCFVINDYEKNLFVSFLKKIKIVKEK